VGSEREPRRTRLRAWPGLGRPGRWSPAGDSRAEAEQHWEQRSGEGTARGGGELASGGLGVATYREERAREGR
jgi:hypothetical protein